jgi:hypothetical protein
MCLLDNHALRPLLWHTGEESRASCVLENLADTLASLGAALQIMARANFLHDSHAL